MNRIDEEKQVVGWMIDLWERHSGENCDELREYAMFRLDHCRFGEKKSTCKKCTVHCYRPEMREKIRQVMRYSGPRMIIYHPIASIKHLIREL